MTSVLGTRAPIMQAAIGRVGGSRLAVAVSAAGGLGTLGASYAEPSDMRQQITEIRQETDRPFCVNLILAFDQSERLQIALTAGAPWIGFSWGVDPELIARTHAAGARALVQVATPRAAREAELAGADVLIVQGVEAGGHVQSTVPLLPLLAEIKTVITTPIVAAGGLTTPGDCRSALRAGADAIAMGTRFVACDESLAHGCYKRRLLEADASDTVLTNLFNRGWDAPHRVLRNETYDRWEAADRPPPGRRPDEDVPIATALFGAVPRYAVNPPVVGMVGDIEGMAMYAGQGVGAIHDIEPAAAIVKRFAAAIG